MIRKLFPDVSFEEYREKRQREHEQRMRECTELDAQLDKLPYKDNIAHVQILGHNRRQCKDWMEINAQWFVFTGFMAGLMGA